MKVASQFLAYLREACAQRGAQTVLIRQSGVSQATISKLATGEMANPTLNVMSAISDALGLCLVKDGDASGQCKEQLKEAQARIKNLEMELAAAKGEIRGLQKALGMAFHQPPKLDDALSPQEKNVSLPEAKSGNQDAG